MKVGEPMNSKVNDLQYALRTGALVNVYQVDDDIVYTGFVLNMDEQGIIVATYDDGGEEDGAVYLSYSTVESVEFSSRDLDNIEFRINYAEDHQSLGLGQIATDFNDEEPLLNQVVESVMQNEAFAMVTLKNTDTYLEGKITRVFDSDLEFSLFDKFDLGRHERLTIAFESVGLIEFNGKELSIQDLAMAGIEKLKPVEESSVESAAAIGQVLEMAQAEDQFLSFVPKSDPEMFFVGQINTLTADTVIVNLVDMAGQFGGYWLTKRSAIDRVMFESDYLQVISQFVMLNEALAGLMPTALNDERLFDPTTDLFQSVLGQAAQFKRVLRIRLHSGEAMVGYLSQIGAAQFIFHEVDEGEVQNPVGQLIATKDVEEIAFDYLEAILIEKQLKVQGDL